MHAIPPVLMTVPKTEGNEATTIYYIGWGNFGWQLVPVPVLNGQVGHPESSGLISCLVLLKFILQES